MRKVSATTAGFFYACQKLYFENITVLYEYSLTVV